jgi:hypothetical protein
MVTILFLHFALYLFTHCPSCRAGSPRPSARPPVRCHRRASTDGLGRATSSAGSGRWRCRPPIRKLPDHLLGDRVHGQFGFLQQGADNPYNSAHNVFAMYFVAQYLFRVFFLGLFGSRSLQFLKVGETSLLFAYFEICYYNS